MNEGEKVLRTLAERRVDGLLMFPPADQPSQEYLQELKNMRRPIVVIDQVFAGSECYDFVGSQDLEGAAAATFMGATVTVGSPRTPRTREPLRRPGEPSARSADVFEHPVSEGEPPEPGPGRQ